jgi:hypothetical protein
VPVELEDGCEALGLDVKVELEGEPDDVDPPADEPPLVAPPPDVFVWPEWPPLQEERLRLRVGRGPAGAASESRDTSPRMCSAYWAGTPDWLTGWVNTTCNPVAVTVSSPDFVAPVAVVPVPSPELVVVVPGGVPGRPLEVVVVVVRV